MRFQRRMQLSAVPSLVPMIDVVFQLVVFFMVSTTFIVTPGIGMTFPASSTADPVVMTRIILTVASEEEIYLNMERYDLTSLSERLEELGQDKAVGTAEGADEVQKTIVLEADEKVPYHLIIEVLDVLRKNGFQIVNLRTRSIPGE